jgi:hypothetical protein
MREAWAAQPYRFWEAGRARLARPYQLDGGGAVV